MLVEAFSQLAPKIPHLVPVAPLLLDLNAYDKTQHLEECDFERRQHAHKQLHAALGSSHMMLRC
jgi:hypothetical protein